MSHEIRNQLGNTLIDQDIIDEITYAVEKDLTYTYFDKTKIIIDSTKVVDGERVTRVYIEGIE